MDIKRNTGFCLGILRSSLREQFALIRRSTRLQLQTLRVQVGSSNQALGQRGTCIAGVVLLRKFLWVMLFSLR
jgi:hypothetical protein